MPYLLFQQEYPQALLQSPLSLSALLQEFVGIFERPEEKENFEIRLSQVHDYFPIGGGGLLCSSLFFRETHT